MAQKTQPKASSGGTLSVQSSLGVGTEEDDDAVAASFLNVNRKIVKTAHEPKPPKDYLDSSTDVAKAADDQKDQADQAEKAKKPNIREATSISMADADKLLVGKPKKDKDDAKEAAKPNEEQQKQSDKSEDK